MRKTQIMGNANSKKVVLYRRLKLNVSKTWFLLLEAHNTNVAIDFGGGKIVIHLKSFMHFQGCKQQQNPLEDVSYDALANPRCIEKVYRTKEKDNKLLNEQFKT